MKDDLQEFYDNINDNVIFVMDQLNNKVQKMKKLVENTKNIKVF